MYISTFTLLIIMLNQGFVKGVKIIELRVAAHMAEGGDALLGCRFDMGSEALYSIKWYKDGKEFFRYVPKVIPHIRAFYVPGVIVDVNRSSMNVVALKRLSRESSGVYQCEVKAEGPSFTMVSSEKSVNIDLLPQSGPRVDGLKTEYHINSRVNVNCTTTPSRPEAQLKWLLNGQPVPATYLRGPFLLIPTNQPFTYQSKLTLDFVLHPSHFDYRGAVTLKCQATIPPLYHQETQYTFFDPSFTTTESPTTTPIPNKGYTMSDIPIVLLFVQVLVMRILNNICSC